MVGISAGGSALTIRPGTLQRVWAGDGDVARAAGEERDPIKKGGQELLGASHPRLGKRRATRRLPDPQTLAPSAPESLEALQLPRPQTLSETLDGDLRAFGSSTRYGCPALPNHHGTGAPAATLSTAEDPSAGHHRGRCGAEGAASLVRWVCLSGCDFLLVPPRRQYRDLSRGRRHSAQRECGGGRPLLHKS
jgi:hypothetical protein